MSSTVYDFCWDDSGDLGVWVQPTGTTDEDALVLVEAMTHEPDRDADCPRCGCAPWDGGRLLDPWQDPRRTWRGRCRHACHDPRRVDTCKPWAWRPSCGYEFASNITLSPGDGVWLEGDAAPIFGRDARKALALLKGIEERGSGQP